MDLWPNPDQMPLRGWTGHVPYSIYNHPRTLTISKDSSTYQYTAIISLSCLSLCLLTYTSQLLLLRRDGDDEVGNFTKSRAGEGEEDL